MRNSVCKYIRNSAEFRGIPGNFTAKNTAEFREISRNSAVFFKKFRIPSEVKNALPWTPYASHGCPCLKSNGFLCWKQLLRSGPTVGYMISWGEMRSCCGLDQLRRDAVSQATNADWQAGPHLPTSGSHTFAQTDAPVEGLNCKKPIQCLASSKILTPASPPGECGPPRLFFNCRRRTVRRRVGRLGNAAPNSHGHFKQPLLVWN